MGEPTDPVERLRQRVVGLEEDVAAVWSSPALREEEDPLDDRVEVLEGRQANHRFRLRRLEDVVATFRSRRFDARRVDRKEVGHHSGSDAQLNISGKSLTEGGFEPGDEVAVATYEGRVVIEAVEEL